MIRHFIGNFNGLQVSIIISVIGDARFVCIFDTYPKEIGVRSAGKAAVGNLLKSYIIMKDR